MEVVDPQQVGVEVAAASLEQLEQDPALGGLRGGDAHQEGQGGRDVDGLDAAHRPAVADPGPGGHEGAVHVEVPVDVDHLRPVAVLAEELRGRDGHARGGRVELVGRPGDHDHVARAGRVLGVAAVDVGQLLLLEHVEDHLAARRPRVLEALEGLDDLVADRVVVGQRDQARLVAAGQVQVDLGRPAGVAGLGLGGGRGGGVEPAVARLLARLEPDVGQDLAGVDRLPGGGEPVVGAGHHDRVVGHEPPGQPQLGVGLVVGAADVAGADPDPAVGRALAVDVVEERVGPAVQVGRGDQAEELVAELVGDREPDHGQVGLGLQLAQDVPDDRVAVAPLQVAALLDVGVLVDDVGLERGEVGRDPGRQVVGDVLLQRVLARPAGRQGRAGVGPAGGVGPGHRGEVDLEVGQVAGQVGQLHVEAGALAGPGADQAVGAAQLDLLEPALAQGGRGLAGVLAGGRRDQQHAVVGAPVVGPGVEHVDVVDPVGVGRGEGGGHGQGRLLGRGGRVALGGVAPAAGRLELGQLVGEPEAGRAGLLVGVGRGGQHPSGREEGGEVDRRAGDVGLAAGHPVELGDLAPGPLGGRGDRVGLEDPGGREAGPPGEVGAGLVEGVVGGAVLARPGAGGQRVPADPGVGREPLGEAVAALDPAPLELADVGHGPAGREAVDQVGPHAVGREQDGRLLLGRRRGAGHSRRRAGRSGSRGREQRGQHGDDQSKGGETGEAAASDHGAPSWNRRWMQAVKLNPETR